MKSILAILPLICSCSAMTLVQPQRVTAREQKAEVACWKSGIDFTLTFYLDVASDTVQRVYTVNNLDPTDVSIGTFDDQNGINGSGTMLDPYTFSITGSGTPVALDTTNRDMKKGYVTSPDVISVRVMAKAMYAPPFYHRVLFKDDVLYTASCNFTELEDKVVSSGQIMVSGDVVESPYLLDDVAELQVVSQGVPTTSVSLGDEISLLVSVNTPTLSTGVYVHSCSVCDRSDCSGLVVQFIDSDGCSVGSHISNFVGTGGAAQTPSFKIFTFNNQDYAHFRCMVNFCYEDNDQRCNNYCDFNTQSGRKKRQAAPAPATEDKQVTAVIRITADDEGLVLVNGQLEPAGQHVVPQSSMALLTSILTLASLLIVGLVVAVIVFFRLSSKSSLSRNRAQLTVVA